MTDYFLPDDYVCNPPLKEHDGPYWTPRRIKSSSYFQYHVYQWARRLADEHRLHRIADIGCGPGTKLMNMFGTEFDVHGFDQPEAIEICRSRYDRGEFEVLDLDDVMACEEKVDIFDLVICADVIEHLEYPERLLEHIRRMSGRHTQILLSTPDRIRLNGTDVRSPNNKAHVREWTRDELQLFLQARGFSVVEAKFFPLMKRTLSVHACLEWWDVLLGKSSKSPCMMILCHADAVT
ncbi:bifunctional 3-demethylubiquinone-9 3-methyltransferase/ 2-octaprenyl-6-hydroxy phenol methylase [Rubripirellula amarantea]|uniref:Bifunctional 3-demethylubiquinone-9 3-methyltransferase/ 2-octaprenyl-6-hydroxy phenol methylase n=1 Tax=Rubripirellula amarantea TaxID=2527999 RepID=A0A5C5WQG2_9BACT|nr:class I SAM-dependent methyltransferase [Rubripirellula amarantea]TWT52690.1 bifunctional 3-demethylubiquinone-9 3-methyltransferase/ 2-octaprenyl-6-hydroxy phenol methylase [Rubripirellula amarantea]